VLVQRVQILLGGLGAKLMDRIVRLVVASFAASDNEIVKMAAPAVASRDDMIPMCPGELIG
jgi:hypothetical protein